jgi:hypothetical protein
MDRAGRATDRADLQISLYNHSGHSSHSISIRELRDRGKAQRRYRNAPPALPALPTPVLLGKRTHCPALVPCPLTQCPVQARTPGIATATTELKY